MPAKASGLDAHRTQQKRRQMRVAAGSRRHRPVTRRLACALRRGRASSRRATGAGARSLVAEPGRAPCLVPAAALATAALRAAVLSDAARRARRRGGGSPIQAMVWPISFSIAATLLLIGRRDDGDGGAAPAGAAGAADAVDVVVGMVRDVEIEDVADIGNVEAARGDVGGDQQRRLRPCGTGRARRCAPTGPCRRAARPR